MNGVRHDHNSTGDALRLTISYIILKQYQDQLVLDQAAIKCYSKWDEQFIARHYSSAFELKQLTIHHQPFLLEVH